MDSPVRKALKRNDYLRHKLFRKIKRRQRNKIQLDLKIAEKELKRRLRKPKFDGGTDDNKVKVTERTYPDGTVVYFADDGKTLTPINTMDSDDMSNWTWQDSDNPRVTYTGVGNTKDPGEIKQGEGPKSGLGKLHKKLYQVSNRHLQDPIFGAYARFADSWDNDTNPLKAIWELPATKAAVMELAWAKGLQAANRLKNAAVNYERLGKMAPKELEEFFMSRPDLVRESNRAKLFEAAYSKFADDVVKPKYASAIAAAGREYTPEMDAAISNTPKVYEADFGPYSKWGGYYSTGGGRIMMNSRAAGTDSQLFGRHAHEVHHDYRDLLGLLLKFYPNLDIQTNGESIAQIARSGYTPGEMNALEAYQFTPLKLKLSPDLKPLWEKGATNAEIVSRIYYDTGLTGKELNDAIMKMPKSKLIEYLNTNAYGQSFLKSPWTKDKEKAIREVLTTVASVMPFGVAYNLKYDGGKKAGIDVTYRDVADAYDYLNANPDASVVLDEQSVVGHAPNANQRLAKYIQESAARDIDKVMLGYLAAGIAPVAMQAAAPGVVAASDAIGGSAAGQVANKVLTNPYFTKGLESAFAGHGLNHAINEGIDGYGDAAMTALELTPLGGLAKPVWNTSKRYIRNIYDKLPWTYNIPEDATMAYRRMGPLERDWLMEGNELSTRTTNPATEAEETAARAAAKGRFNLFKAGAEHGGRKQFAKGQLWKGTTVTHGEEQVLAIPGKNLPWVSGRHYKGPQGRSFQVGEVPFEEAPFGSHIDLLTEEGFTGVNPSLLDGSVIYSPYKIFGHKFGYKKMYPKTTITAENAASMTPKQWTAAQDAAIARGDMAEAQRLRDLHFKVKSNTVVQNNNLPLKTYHTVNESYPADFNVFNPNIEGTHSAIYTSDSPIMSGTYANSLISNEEKEYYIQRGIDNLKYLVENNLAKGDDLIKARNALKSTESAREYVLSKTPWLNTRPNPTRQKQLYVKLNNPLMTEGHSRNWNDIPIHELPKKVYDNLRASNMNGYTTRDIERAQKLAGYDGGIIKNITDYGSTRKSSMIERKPSTVYQINSPNNLKLADAVTFDDNGIRIPLGDRDNFNVNDFRWSWLLPIFGIGAGAYGAELYNSGKDIRIRPPKRGGNDNNPRIITTGGAGYIPDNYGQGSIDYIRRALYDNITPFGYHNPVQRVFNAIADKQDNSRAGENALINSGDAQASALDAIWGTYLGIPANRRRKINSKYNISKVPGGYYKFNDPNLVLNFDSDLSPQGLYSQKGRKAQQMNGILGNYTVGLGRDNKGDYIYYSDSRLNKDGSPDLKTGWDINPYSNTVDDATEETTESRGQYGQDKKSFSYKVGQALFGNVSDLSMGIGKPVPIYDRVYLDDYYGVPYSYRGGVYLPEVTVYGKRRNKIAVNAKGQNKSQHNSGKDIHIKPSRRGTFTAAAKKRGMSVQAYARKVLKAPKGKYSSAMRKKANFARNAAKFKH